MKKLLIDTDAGVDDALAILAALGAQEEAEVVALTTVAGNVGLDQATANVALIRAMFDPACTVPISQGGRKCAKSRALSAYIGVHGRDGLGNIGVLRAKNGVLRHVWPAPSPTPLSAAEQISAQCGLHGPGLTCVFIGPLTNLAQALRHNGPRALNGARVVIMGGSFRAGRNRVRRADFNLGADVTAAREVLEAGVMPDLLPLETCESYILTREFLARMAREHPSAKAQFISDIHQHYMDYYHREVIKTVDGCYPHDAIAVACALRPDLFSFEPRAVEIVTERNGSYGHTLALPEGKANVRVVRAFDPDEFEACLVSWVWGEGTRDVKSAFDNTCP